MANRDLNQYLIPVNQASKHPDTLERIHRVNQAIRQRVRQLPDCRYKEKMEDRKKAFNRHVAQVCVSLRALGSSTDSQFMCFIWEPGQTGPGIILYDRLIANCKTPEGVAWRGEAQDAALLARAAAVTDANKLGTRRANQEAAAATAQQDQLTQRIVQSMQIPSGQPAAAAADRNAADALEQVISEGIPPLPGTGALPGT